MKAIDRLKTVTYLPIVVKMVKLLHLRAPLRALYYYFTKPKNKIKKISFCGIDAQFYVPTPLELRMVETPFNNCLGDERATLKKLLEAISPGDVIYDIGANIGVQTIFMAKKTGEGGRVIAIEPESGSFNSLNANIALNALHNVKTIQTALGKDCLESKLYSGRATGDCSIVNKNKAKPYQETIVMPGDLLIEKYNLAWPNIVEIDVEGYEYYVITGLKKALSQVGCKLVFCEIHPFMLPGQISVEQCIELLRSCGFKRIETFKRGDTLHTFSYRG
jgi:FkbM family methyltransferase